MRKRMVRLASSDHRRINIGRLSSLSLMILPLLVSLAIGAVALWTLYMRVDNGTWPAWTGFDTYTLKEGQHPAKTLWDLLELLIIPVVLAVGAYLLNRSERRNEQKISDDRLAEAALQNYLDKMTELLLSHGLRESAPDAEVRHVARSRTLSILRTLDPGRKLASFRFLFEAELIESDQPVVSLQQADLRKINLDFIKLERVNLCSADLTEASLVGTVLNEAYLHGATLFAANLQWAELKRADLRYAIMNRTNLIAADLTGAFLTKTLLGYADLRNAKLCDAELIGANLGNAKLENADLSGAQLKGAFLLKSKLADADISGADFTDATVTTRQLNSASNSALRFGKEKR
jgi:uncharacterized protein YjbI with pentapeptide repeats